MSDMAVNEPDNAPGAPGFLLDGDAPRLGGSQPIVPPAPAMFAADPALPTPAPPAPQPSVFDAGAPSLPTLPPTPTPAPTTVASVFDEAPAPVHLPAPHAEAVPLLTALQGPSLPSAPAAAPTPVEDKVPLGPDGAPPHPMAHLMPGKSQQTESQKRAAELRAAKKRKAKKMKIVFAIGFLIVAAIVGPPLGKWLMDAINEAGSTKSDVPATSVPATSVPAGTVPTASIAPVSAPTASDPATSSAPGGLGGLVGAVDQAQQAVDQTNANVPGATPLTTAAPTIPATPAP